MHNVARSALPHFYDGVMCAHVLVAEDNAKQSALIRLYLEEDGHDVVIYSDGLIALESIRRSAPDLVILDGMLPSLDGLEVCRLLRLEFNLPVIMLTARSSEPDLLSGLAHGADDYMTKPFSPAELVARVRTLLRRTRHDAPQDDELVQVGGLVLNLSRHTASVEGVPVVFTSGEFRLLHILGAQPGRVFTRPQLLERLHGFDQFITERTIDVHIKNVRKKIEQAPRRPRFLITVYGVGYKLDGDGANVST